MSEPQRPERPRTAPGEDPVVRRRLGVFSALLVACFVTSWLPLPWSLATLGFAAWAVGLGVATLSRARRTGERGLVVPLVVVGLLSSGLLAVSTASTLLVWPVQKAWQECRAGAVTVGALEECDRRQREDLENFLRERLRLPARDEG